MTTQDLLAAVKSIQPLIEAHAAEAEANRQLSSVVYDAMYRANLFAMSAPRARGGLELHPVESMQVWEAIARIDSAAAWNLVTRVLPRMPHGFRPRARTIFSLKAYQL